jgi:hypothetical protein
MSARAANVQYVSVRILASLPKTLKICPPWSNHVDILYRAERDAGFFSDTPELDLAADLPKLKPGQMLCVLADRWGRYNPVIKVRCFYLLHIRTHLHICTHIHTHAHT